MHIHYYPIFVASLINFSLGTFWFSPALFGNIWKKLLEKDKNTSNRTVTLKTYGSIFLVILVYNFIMWALINRVRAVGMWEGVYVGSLVWAGFCATAIAIQFLFEGRSRLLFGISAGYSLIMCIVSGALFAMW